MCILNNPIHPYSMLRRNSMITISLDLMTIRPTLFSVKIRRKETQHTHTQNKCWQENNAHYPPTNPSYYQQQLPTKSYISVVKDRIIVDEKLRNPLRPLYGQSSIRVATRQQNPVSHKTPIAAHLLQEDPVVLLKRKYRQRKSHSPRLPDSIFKLCSSCSAIAYT